MVGTFILLLPTKDRRNQMLMRLFNLSFGIFNVFWFPTNHSGFKTLKEKFEGDSPGQWTGVLFQN
jgi:hypothetical protein|tara:strand:+ start:722 stop:916 length:195 start_codon:yes stop_codon:yes gene_type:complete